MNDVGVICFKNDTTKDSAGSRVSRVSAETSGYRVKTGPVRWSGTFLESPASTLGSVTDIRRFSLMSVFTKGFGVFVFGKMLTL